MTPMIVEHPLLQHKISLLRNKQTGTKESVSYTHLTLPTRS